uniref:Thioredoxin domain-containing protein n=2 Tax=Araucaria cunninghamii TaxID=56994 RepID=A0A0D6R4C3_ARACU
MNICFASPTFSGNRVMQTSTILCGLRSQYPLHNGISLKATLKTRIYHQFGYFDAFPRLRHVHLEKYVIRKKKISGKPKAHAALNAAEYRKMKAESQGKLFDDEDDKDVCPVDCVKEFRTNAELEEILEEAKTADALVVVDFYRTACGSCKYIEQGFVKLCKGAGDEEASVIFLKHNVMDEYDEQSEVAERLKIKVVPLFHFYKDGILVDAFPTREKNKLIATIRKLTSRRVDHIEE